MKLIVFGTGHYYQSAKKYMNMDDILCFVDNDNNKSGTYLDGKVIKKPDQVDYSECDYVLILIMRYQEVIEQLNSLGVSEDKIKCYPDFDDLYSVDTKVISKGRELSVNEWIDCYHEKKVMLVCHELDRNGVSVVLMQVARMLKKMGYRVLMSALLGGELQEELETHDIDCIPQINMIYGSDSFKNLVKATAFTVVGTIGIAEVAKKIASTDIPIVWWIHESNDKDFNDFPIVKRKNVHYYAGGQRVVECFKRHYPDLSITKWLYYLPEEVSEKGLESGVFRIAMIGLIYRRKAQDILMQAYEKVPEELKSNISLEFIGKNIDSIIDIDKVVDEHDEISYLGLMTQEELKKYFSTVNLLVCPSRDDPMPVVVTQAMQNGIPCIVSDQVGQSEYIQDGESGFVFESENTDELEKKLEFCLKNREELQKIGKRSREIYDEYFSASAIEKNLKSIISNIGC